MKFFKNVLKNKLFYLVLLLGVFLIPILKFSLKAQEEDDYVDYSNKNLASPDLEGKEYFGYGYYILYDNNGITIEYNVYNGVYTVDGTWTGPTGSSAMIPLLNVNGLTLTVSVDIVSGNLPNAVRYRPSSLESKQIYLFEGISYEVPYDRNYDAIRMVNGAVFDNFQFNVQLEKGDTATSYTVPLQPYLWHEKQLSYDDGFDDGFRDGESLGYSDGYDDGYAVGYDDGYEGGTYEGFEDGYDWGRSEYGIYINDEWFSAVDYGDIKYNDGYQDGESDTHDYYNDNGLFIPRFTPKGHLVIEYTPSYNDPYFYLQDLHNVDDVYFGYQYSRWLERAFDWAYDVEEDFLVINDLYAIKYQSDETLYTYFFYKYDTDSIYFYNDNGTLIKIVERDDFDYYVYEVPELSQEEQARIDNAYNKGMRDYGYYDSESEEYLTATEYGEIEYNRGVISTRDNAYSDGFVVAMWYSHLYGYDWLHATYYDLIVERPILYSVHDITSFAYGEGYDDGFDDGDSNGYNRGYDWGYEDGKIDGIDIGYDDGYNDGESDGYDLGYQKAVDNTYDVIYDDIYKIGYKDGQKTGMNNKFYSGLEKWIVPAIIVVLFFGLLMLFPKNKED